MEIHRGQHGNFPEGDMDIGIKLAQQSKNYIITQTLNIWCKMVKEYDMERDIKLLIWPALDHRFEPGISDAVFRWSWDRGITVVCTLTHRGLFKSFRELQKEFGLKTKDFFRYLQIRHYYDKRIKPTLPGEANTVIENQRKIISKIYLGVQKQNGTYTGNISAK